MTKHRSSSDHEFKRSLVVNRAVNAHIADLQAMAEDLEIWASAISHGHGIRTLNIMLDVADKLRQKASELS